jgi:RNA polymerase sigma-70 factor (ECF subfamily)
VTGELNEAVKAAQSGDEDAFRFLYRSLQPGLLRYLTALVGADAEDVASEAWLQISRDLPSFTGGEFRAWTVTIARNRAMILRRRASTGLPVPIRPRGWRGSDTASGPARPSEPRRRSPHRLLPPRRSRRCCQAVIGLDTRPPDGYWVGGRAVRTAAHRGLRRLATLLDRSEDASPTAGIATPPRPRSGRGRQSPTPPHAEPADG